MKNIIFLFVSIFLSLHAFAQSTETRNLKPFSKILVSEGIVVNLIKGTESKAIVSVYDIDINRIKTNINGDFLKIFIKKEDKWKSFMKSSSIKIDLYYQDISFLKVTSGAKLTHSQAMSCEDLVLKCSSGATIDIKSIEANSIEITNSSSGRISSKIITNELAVNGSSSSVLDLDGESDIVHIKVSSSATVQAENLNSKDAFFKASSSGKIVFNEIDGDLKADASSGGRIFYNGTPKNSDVASSSGGKISRN